MSKAKMCPSPTSCTYLEEVGNVLIDVGDELLGRIFVVDAAFKLAMVGRIVEQYGIRPSCRLCRHAPPLKVSFNGTLTNQCMTRRTSGLSMPMPKAFVATMTRFCPSLHAFCRSSFTEFSSPA